MVNIDTVYQKVLALANKEQRGYITPQEFNLLADRVQKEIFENYFHDIKTAQMKPKNQVDYADDVEIIEEKLNYFISEGSSFSSSSTFALGTGVYRLISVSRNGNEMTELNKKEILYTENNPLTAATLDRSVYVRTTPSSGGSNRIEVYPSPSSTTYDTDTNSDGVFNSEELNITYYKMPTSPKWAYIIVQEKALYNSNETTNFELHPSEEELIVSKILQLAGVTIMKPGIVEIGKTEAASIKAEQNN